MKKLFNISLAALAAMVVGLSACNKTVVVDDEVVGKDNGLILVNLFDADSPATRSTVALSSYEKVIRSAQVFVFSDGQNTTLGLADGQLETSMFPLLPPQTVRRLLRSLRASDRSVSGPLSTHPV